jgi:hypothetical protein
MFLTPKQIISSIYLILVCCSGIYITKAMEQSTLEIEKSTEEQTKSLANLPPELKAYIISFLISAKNADEAVKNIKFLAATSKEFYNLINDPHILGNLMLEISNRFNSLSGLANLPEKIENHHVCQVISFLTNPYNLNLQKALKNTMLPSLLSKEFFESINDPRILGSLILEISNRFKMLPSSVARALLSKNIGVGISILSPLDIAIKFSTPSALKWLENYLQQNPQEKEHLDQLLIEAAKEGDKNLIEFLLKAGATVNEQNEYGATPLWKAVTSGNKEIVELLLDAGADVNKAGEGGLTMLQHAANEGYKDIGKLLLEAGADVNQADNYGRTPLRWAASNGHKDTVELLLAYGVDVNTVDRDRCTPLDLAVSLGHKDVVELLLDAGADVSKTDILGRTPLHYAIKKSHKKGYKDIVELLRKHGAVK